MAKALISFREATELTGHSEATLRRWHRAGDLPVGIVLRLNGRWYIRRAALLAWRDKVDLDGERTDAPAPARLTAIGGGA